MKKRADLDKKNFDQMSVYQNNLIQLIYGMQDIKLLGSEKQKRWEWEGIQASLFHINLKTLNLGQWQQGGAVLINEVKNVLITIISATAVLNGSITLGAMLSIQYIIGQMQGPMEQFVQFMQQTQDAQLSLERLGEIHSQPDEETGGLFEFDEIRTNQDITFKDVSFTYGATKSKRIIKNLSLHNTLLIFKLPLYHIV